MSEENKELVRRAYNAMKAGDIAFLREVMADDFVEHEETPGFEPTKDGVLEYFEGMRGAFSDFEFVIDDLAAEGDMVIVRARMTGTHKAEFMGIPATGKQINVPVADFLRIVSGKAVEHWGVTDTGAMLMQLGVVEMPGT